MFILCMVASILTGLGAALHVQAAGSGVVMTLVAYGLSGAVMLIVSMCLISLGRPGWRAFP